MRDLLPPLSLALLLTVAVDRVALGDPILLVDGRIVTAATVLNNQSRNVIVNTPSVPFASFDRVVTATATVGGVTAQTTTAQRSSLSPSLFSASGSIESSSTMPAGFASAGTGISIFDIVFDLPAPATFALTDLMIVNPMESTGGSGKVSVELTNEFPNPAVFFFQSVSFGSLQFNRTGILGAGRHRLFAEVDNQWAAGAEGRSPHASSFDLLFRLTPVPEPGSLILLGGGLLALASRWARRSVAAKT